jgi:drug/metabolite transporter (DMT)-like permease
MKFWKALRLLGSVLFVCLLLLLWLGADKQTPATKTSPAVHTAPAFTH